MARRGNGRDIQARDGDYVQSYVDEPFADLAFAEALTKTREEEKLLLVDFTATWCPPCKRMKKDTWGDDDVRAWLSKNAISIQVDVDQEIELARRFEVEAMPTVVVFRDGEEFDRIIGYKDARAFLTWGKSARRGIHPNDALRERARELAESDDVRARYDLARELMRAREYDTALKHYLWLWPATRGTSHAGVRGTFMLGDIAELMEKHEPAREAFIAILEDLQAKVYEREMLPLPDHWDDWTAMCTHFGESARMVTWYEEHRDENGKLLVGSGPPYRGMSIVEDVFEVLLSHDRHVDAVGLLSDPVAYARDFAGHYEIKMRFDRDDDERDWNRRHVIERLSHVHGALLAAERPDQASAVSGILLRSFDTPEARMTLVSIGMRITRHPHEMFARWLDEAEQSGAKALLLRKRLQRLSKSNEEAGGSRKEGDT